jgi:hypothetical protein
MNVLKKRRGEQPFYKIPHMEGYVTDNTGKTG